MTPKKPLSDKAALREAKKLVNKRNSELRKKSRKALREIDQLVKRVHKILPHHLDNPTHIDFTARDDGKVNQLSIITRDAKLIIILYNILNGILKEQSDANNSRPKDCLS